MKRFTCLQALADVVDDALVVSSAGAMTLEWNSLRPSDGNFRVRTLGLCSSIALGMAQGAYDAALRYSKLRKQFGRPISEFQAIQHKLVDMAVDLDAARLLNYRAAWMLDRGILVFGVDASTCDHAKDRATHMLMRNRVCYHMENLANLDKLPQDRIFTFVCTPLMMLNSSASPVRALALVPK